MAEAEGRGEGAEGRGGGEEGGQHRPGRLTRLLRSHSSDPYLLSNHLFLFDESMSSE